MKMLLIAGLVMFSSTSFAADLEDVKILEMKPGPENFELKLETKKTFFFVNIIRSDADSFTKLTHVIRKLVLKEKYKLDLKIPSFSASPSGSYYQSPGLVFTGSEVKKK